MGGKTVSTYPLCCSKRLFLSILCSMGIANMMLTRFNLSVAIVCMTKDSSDHKKAEFSWSEVTKSDVLGAFFYGYLAAQIPGGCFADLFGTKKMIVLGIGLLSVGALVSPVAARSHHAALIVVRVIQGLASGLAFPCLYAIIVAWSSPQERATLMTIAWMGISISSSVNFPLASKLCELDVDGGWPMTFYLPGSIGLLWTFAFMCIVHGQPQNDPRLKEEEKEYLLASRTAESKGTVSPKDVNWLKLLLNMFTSIPFLGILFAHFAYMWGYYLITVLMPSFYSEILGLSILHNGVYSCFPFIGMLIFSGLGPVFDYLRRRSYLSLLNLRRIFNTLGFAVPCFCVFFVNIINEDNIIGYVALMTVTLSFGQFALTGGFYFSHSEIAGPYKTVAYSVTNTIAQIPGIILPKIKVSMLSSLEERKLMSKEEIHKEDSRAYEYLFDMTGAVYIVGTVAYLLMASDQLQPWAKAETDPSFSSSVDSVDTASIDPEKANVESVTTDHDDHAASRGSSMSHKTEKVIDDGIYKDEKMSLVSSAAPRENDDADKEMPEVGSKRSHSTLAEERDSTKNEQTKKNWRATSTFFII